MDSSGLLVLLKIEMTQTNWGVFVFDALDTIQKTQIKYQPQTFLGRGS